MRIEIDQSGKIEDTNKDTIIAFSNEVFGSILIKAKDKREVQKIFRKIGKPKIFVYKLFAILIFLLIKKHLKKINQIIIDEEYPGKSVLIKDYLLREIRKVRPNFPKRDISFSAVGKKSKAHYLAYGVAIGKKLADKTVSVKEILRFVVK
jgi:hypothetical protein